MGKKYLVADDKLYKSTKILLIILRVDWGNGEIYCKNSDKQWIEVVWDNIYKLHNRNFGWKKPIDNSK